MNKIKFLLTFSLIVCSLLSAFLVGIFCVYKGTTFIQKESACKLLNYTIHKADSFSDVMELTEKYTTTISKIFEKTFNNKEFNKTKKTPNLYKYDENKIPYISEHLKRNINPLVEEITKDNNFIRTAYFNYIPYAFNHPKMVCSWGVKDSKDKFNFLSCGDAKDYKNLNKEEFEWLYGPIKTKKGYWTKLYIDKDINTPMISYVEPVFVNNKVIGVAGIDISLADIKKTVESLNIYETGVASILDKDFKVIFSRKHKPHEDLSNLIKHSPLLKESSNAFVKKNNNYLIAYTYMPNNYIFMVEVAEEEVLAEVNDVKRAISFILLFIFAFSIFVSIQLGSYISRPFQKLKDISQKLIEMDFSIKIDEDYKIAEINSFVDALKQFIKVSKENQKNKDLINSIFDSLIDALLVINEKGIIFSVTPSVTDIFGYNKQEIVGKHIDKLFKNSFFSIEGENGDDFNLINNKIEALCIKKDNSIFSAEIGVNELLIGEKPCFTVLIRDISYQKQVDNIKNDFVSTVSHELRTPLTSIMGVLGLLLNMDFEKNPEKTKELLNIANNNSTRLLNLVNDILDMQKLEAGKIDFIFSKVNLQEAVNNLVKLNKSYGDKYGVSITFIDNCSEPVFIKADKDRFSQSITNLVSNAIKFSPANGDVKIILTQDGDKIRLSVEDKGKGIPEALRSKIFKKFSQLAATNTRSKDGTGLGLYITKYLVENMNGTIDFHSETDKGTEFFVEFPILKL